MKKGSCYPVKVNTENERKLTDEQTEQIVNQIEILSLQKEIVGLETQISFLERKLADILKENGWLYQEIDQTRDSLSRIVEEKCRLEMENKKLLPLVKSAEVLKKNLEKTAERLRKKRKESANLKRTITEAKKILTEVHLASFPACDRRIFERLEKILLGK